MRVLLLSIYHDPEPIPKTGELARELQRRGHEVTVVTAFPHYPAGRLYPGYRLAPWRWEIREGVRVLRTFIYPYHGRSTPLRMLNYLSWMVSSLQAIWLAPRCDVMYVWHPPLTVGVSAAVIAAFKRVSYVYDVQDLWPESALASGLMRPGRIVRFLYRLADWVYARAPRLFVVSDAARRYLQGRGVPIDKIEVAHHWLDTSPFDQSVTANVRTEFGWERRFVVMFAGNLGMVQGLETVVQAAAVIRDHADVLFVFVGDGSDRVRLEALVADLGLQNVQFVGRHPADQMPSFMRSADALVVHLRPSPIADHAIPTKILAYLAAGRPVVCGTGGAAEEVVRMADAGVTVPPGDATALARAVLAIKSMSADERCRLGENGRAYLHSRFNRDRIIDHYERTLAALVRRTRPDLGSAEAPQ